MSEEAGGKDESATLADTLAATSTVGETHGDKKLQQIDSTSISKRKEDPKGKENTDVEHQIEKETRVANEAVHQQIIDVKTSEEQKCWNSKQIWIYLRNKLKPFEKTGTIAISLNKLCKGKK